MLPFFTLLLSAATLAHKIPIFLLAGQSNMSGRGGVAGNSWDHFHLTPPPCRPTPDILRLSSRLLWEEAREPLHADIDVHKTCGVGPGMPFAHAVLAGGSAPAPLGLVPCAVGGTAISEWGRGRRLYLNLVRRARAAVEKGGILAAVLWYQGESDTVSKVDAEAYGRRMETLVWDLRRDLDEPDLLVIQVALASGEGKYVDIVRKAQKGMKVRNVLCVDADGLQLEPDNLHLTTGAQVTLGQMLADAYLNHTAVSSRFVRDL
ncbi:probable carbohydrate esterase At4g34215 [Phalaenopsis equestris]|uniref:probable carbohydrate esterase At4g34215 n=1 Tax=Phalaenopsis equestris TaxID=78828 RepID=UPI0009E2F1A8|nr:probable carbohydrate esterase At4g34215 [Phalaenopsis equestris]